MTEPRAVHLVGSMPSDSADEAMRTALTQVGDHLRSLPDGETGNRRDWAMPMILGLADHPDFEETRAGRWSTYDDASRVRVRRGHRLRAEALDFGHVAAFETSFPLLRRLGAEHGRRDLTFQVGLPGDLDLAMLSLGPLRGFRHRRTFARATLRDIRTIHERAGDQVLFQLEMPIELVLVTQAPPVLRRALAGLIARDIAWFAKRLPRGARFGLHLCLGDLGNKAMKVLPDAGPVVALTNALAQRWPEGARLEYIHAPFAAGDEPAPLGGDFYRPLQGLRLPSEVRFVAGFVHEKRSVADLRATLATIEADAGRSVDLAAACGLGRRTAAAAQDVLTKAALLAQPGPN